MTTEVADTKTHRRFLLMDVSGCSEVFKAAIREKVEVAYTSKSLMTASWDAENQPDDRYIAVEVTSDKDIREINATLDDLKNHPEHSHYVCHRVEENAKR